MNGSLVNTPEELKSRYAELCDECTLAKAHEEGPLR
jgi:hypothetical protein